jgi:hypothetical protein
MWTMGGKNKVIKKTIKKGILEKKKIIIKIKI